MKFISFVAILYIGMSSSKSYGRMVLTMTGFDTCFTFLARGNYTLAKLNWILVKVVRAKDMRLF